MNNHALFPAAAVAAAVLLAGCSTPDVPGSTPGTAGSMSHHAEETSGGTAENNSADTMFAQMMIPHHEQAITMSDIMLAKEGLDPRITELAGKIKAAQGPEIQKMEDWLHDWNEPGDPMAGHSMMMDGMLSDEDLAALEEAQGTEAARLFLTQMIAHHEGAVEMAEDEAAAGGNAGAVELAEAIRAEQNAEIEQMRALLRDF
ncbi:DUF305 domain-containing protein [Arthrobacter sp. NPDC055585]